MKLYSALAVFCLPVILSTDLRGQEDDQPLTLYGGVTIYNNPVYDSVALVEFPFSLNRHEFAFYRPDTNDSNLYARVFAQIELFDAAGRPLDSASTFFSLLVASRQEAELSGLRVFNRLVLFAAPGSYSARLTVIDAVSKRQGEFFVGKFAVDSIAKEHLTIGGACVAYSLKYVGEAAPYANFRLVKNGFEVIVNPLSIFSTNDSVVHLYGEVYNLAYREDVPSTFHLSFSAWDSAGNLFRDLGGDTLVKPGSTAVIAESFDMAGWPPGLYRLRVIASDYTTNESDTVSVPLRIVSPEEIRLAAFRAAGGDPYDTLSLEVKTRLVTYLLTPDQKATLARLTDEGKLNFLKQYWRENDEDPTTKVVENRLELIKRYAYCNRYFSAQEGKSDGWATDRGRIYMTYGPWDEIDERQAPLVGDPYEIWYYRLIREGKLFVFEDWTGVGDYRLVHSNVYGEIYSQEWQDRIDQGLTDMPVDQ